jgi:hypothetical protein
MVMRAGFELGRWMMSAFIATTACAACSGPGVAEPVFHDDPLPAPKKEQKPSVLTPSKPSQSKTTSGTVPAADAGAAQKPAPGNDGNNGAPNIGKCIGFTAIESEPNDPGAAPSPLANNETCGAIDSGNDVDVFELDVLARS